MSWRILSNPHRLDRLAIKAIRDKSSSSAPTTFTMNANEWMQFAKYKRNPILSDTLELFQTWCSKPPKGFEKFFKDKPKTGGAKPEAPKAPKSASAPEGAAKPKMPRPPPAKPNQDLSELFKKGFKGSGAGGGMGNMSDPEKQKMATMVGLGLATVLGLALLNQSRYKEISWKEFVGSYLSTGRVEKLEVINSKWVKVQLSSGMDKEVLWFSIGSVDTFERNLETAEGDLGMEKNRSIPVLYKTWMEASSVASALPTLFLSLIIMEVEGLAKNTVEANNDIINIANNPFSLRFPTIEIFHGYVDSWRSVEKCITSNICLIAEQSNSTIAGPMAKSMTDQENEREVEKIPCVIFVGSTGAGKSTLIKKMTKQDITVGSGPESVTKQIDMYEEKGGFVTTVLKKAGKLVGMSSKPKFVWVDTQGFEDNTNEQDNVVFLKIFQFLKDNNISHIQSIIWNITPQERMTAPLQRQANLINQFGNENVNIWDNVLIVCKKMRDTRLEAQGAIEAANLVQCENGQLARPPPRHIGFTIMDDEQVQKKVKTIKGMHYGTCDRSKDRTKDHPSNDNDNLQHNLTKSDFCTTCSIGEIKFEDCKSVSSCKVKYEELKDLLYFWEDDVIRSSVKTLMEEMKVIKIQYKIQKCKSCGEKNDYRLMSSMCHTDYEEVHGEWENYHTESGEKIHTGRKPPFHKVEGKPSITGTTFSCCGKNESNWGLKGGNAGCIRFWSCCGKEKDAEGCSQVKFYKCCQGERPEGHTCDPSQKHKPITEFSYPFHVFNPLNWNIGGFWTTKYITVCHHDPNDPGCKDFYPCCSRFKDDDKGGCKLNKSSGCKIRCPWCKMDLGTNKKGCRKVCKQCKGFWGNSKGCTLLPERRTHDVQDLVEESQSSS